MNSIQMFSPNGEWWLMTFGMTKSEVDKFFRNNKDGLNYVRMPIHEYWNIVRRRYESS